jgi:tripartite-type tricarboxylate transporter receptor subunit TctC
MAGRMQWVLVLALAATGFCSPALAQDFPNRPIKFIVPFSPGAGTDATGRIVAEGLARRIGQPVVVENKPGAGSMIGIEYVVKSPPDGYTLLYGTADGITVLPAVSTKVPYRVPEDVLFLTRTFTMPFAIAVSPSLPVNTWDEFIAYAKANPGKVRYATSGIGGGGHLATALLEKTAGISMTHIPYKGVGQFIPDLLSGNVDVGLVTPPTINPHYTAGKVKVLAQSGTKRHALLPNVPTFVDLNLKDAVVEVWYGVMAPPGLPPAVRDKLKAELALVLKDPETLDRLAKAGWVPDSIDGDAFRQFAVNELGVWKGVAKAAKIEISD